MAKEQNGWEAGDVKVIIPLEEYRKYTEEVFMLGYKNGLQYQIEWDYLDIDEQQAVIKDAKSKGIIIK